VEVVATLGSVVTLELGVEVETTGGLVGLVDDAELCAGPMRTSTPTVIATATTTTRAARRGCDVVA
jgi:hypothetical protein